MTFNPRFILLLALPFWACAEANLEGLDPEEAPPVGDESAGFAKADHSNIPSQVPAGEQHSPDTSSGLPDGQEVGGDAGPSPLLTDAAQTAPDTHYSPDGFQYECEVFTTGPCVTECGTTGERECIKEWGPCVPPPEICNGIDDDCDGLIDNGVSNACGGCGDVPAEVCNGVDDDCDEAIDEGVSNACGTCGAVPIETCNGVDDDCDGATDEGLTNACGGCGPLGPEVCNGIDDDCDGVTDGIPFELNFSGDCLFVECPSYAPFPTACNIVMQGGDHRGCVASQPNLPVVYLQEGNQCGSGSLGGTLTCSCSPGGGLNEANCPINKPKKFYPAFPSGCPD